jgi:hypothetical protein
MPFDWSDYLALALELSRTAGEAAHRSAASRAYYSAFNFARQHRGARRAHASQSGSHAAVWRALATSGNPGWQRAGNLGKFILEYRLQCDYDNEVPELISKMHRILRISTEIRQLLG